MRFAGNFTCVEKGLTFSNAAASGTVILPEGLPAMFECRGRRQALAAGVNRVVH